MGGVEGKGGKPAGDEAKPPNAKAKAGEAKLPSRAALSLVRTEEAVVGHLCAFTRRSARLKKKYLQQLRAISSTLSASECFSRHQFVNSSLLFVHDARRRRARVWMIDFSKARPSERELTHEGPWELGNEEDGYLLGLRNLIRCFERI